LAWAVALKKKEKKKRVRVREGRVGVRHGERREGDRFVNLVNCLFELYPVVTFGLGSRAEKEKGRGSFLGSTRGAERGCSFRCSSQWFVLILPSCNVWPGQSRWKIKKRSGLEKAVFVFDTGSGEGTLVALN